MHPQTVNEQLFQVCRHQRAKQTLKNALRAGGYPEQAIDYLVKGSIDLPHHTASPVIWSNGDNEK